VTGLGVGRGRPRHTRGRFTYANVTATLALFLALSGGVVWAANKITSKQIGKGAVKTKNLAKGAVKAKNLAKKSVTSAKLAKGAVKNAKLGDGAVNFAKIAPGTNVVATASAGPLQADQAGPVDVPLNPPLTLTSVAGQPLTLNIEARGTLAQNGTSDCFVVFVPRANGEPLTLGELLTIFAPDDEPNPLIPNGIPQTGVTLPVGLTRPGTTQAITLLMFGDPDCTSGSRVDQVAVAVTRAK
jgi:hypothetical protein